jgi:hypothetical protein
MQAYMDFFDGKLVDEPYDEKALAAAMSELPEVAAE